MEQKNKIKQLKKVFTAIANQMIDPTFKFSEGGATIRVLQSFLDKLAEENSAIAEERIVDVCVNIAYIYRNNFRPVKNMFSLSSIERFNESRRGKKYYEDEWLKTGSLTRSSLLSLIADRKEHPLSGYLYMANEEPRKLRLHNKKTGFMICQTSTLGWSPMSDACNTCNFSDDCKKLTNINYPELYRIRTEYGNRSK